MIGIIHYLSKSSYKVEIYDNVLTLNECNQVIQTAKKLGLKPSESFNSTTGKTDDNHDYRKSQTIFIEPGNLSPYLEQKFIDIAKQFVPDAKFEEDLQVVYYKPGDYFKSHLDASDYMEDNIESDDVKTSIGRRYTLLFYLNDVEHGGETRFVNINQVVQPKMGRVAFWSNLGDDKRPIQESEHEGRPPESGEKWIVNYWIH
jgi:prolyl 4-hydroxylase